MLEHLGLTVSRAIPPETLAGLATKALSLHGGVVRDSAGRIVAHLALPLKAGVSSANPVSAVFDVVNTFQLAHLSEQVQQVLSVSLLNTALSGLSLATAIVGFAYLSVKMKQIDDRLETVAKDVKDIKRILKSRQRAQLIEAIDTLQLSADAVDSETRRQLLIRSRGSFGELAHHYKTQVLESSDVREIEAEEDYYTLAFLGLAICTSELGMGDGARDELSRHYSDWNDIARKRCGMTLEGDNARLLDARYVASLPAATLVDLLDFAYRENRGIGWIDDLRAPTGKASRLRRRRVIEPQFIDYTKKLRARDHVLQGYASHFAFLAEKKLSATYFANAIEQLREREQAPLLWITTATAPVRGRFASVFSASRSPG
jgi:hypothetical protein